LTNFDYQKNTAMNIKKIKVQSEFHAYAFWITLGVMGFAAAAIGLYVSINT